jgi:pimeloyl-ACP methyl ester carboxylesterase
MIEKKYLNYRVVGQGHPIVFLHGFLENNSMWDKAIHFYKNTNKCILVELFGHGKSTIPENPFSIAQLAEEVIKVVNGLTDKTYSVVGHSLGGYVALEMLCLASDKINRITLLNSHPWEDDFEKKKERTRLAEIVKENKSLFIRQAIPNLFKNQNANREIIDKLITEASKITEEAIINTTYAMRDRKDNCEVLISNKSKALIIQGEFDHLIPAKKMVDFCNDTGIPFRYIKNGDHMCWVDENIYPLSLH